MNNRDYWVLTLSFLFERVTSLIHQKNKQIDKFFDRNIGSMDVEELNAFVKDQDKRIDEICKLIDYVYKYQYRKENPFENYIPATENKE